VNAHEIVVHEVDYRHARVVFGLLGKGIRESRHAPVAHADIQVLALYKARGDVFLVGSSPHETQGIARTLKNNPVI
jgi:hypothetical protein